MGLGPLRGRRSCWGVFALGLLLLVSIGCLSSSPSDGTVGETEPADPTGASPEANASEQWEEEFTFTPSWPGAAVGRPFLKWDHFLAESCDVWVTLEIPENATSVQTRLSGDPTDPGTGYMVHSVWDGTRFHYPGPVTGTPAGDVYGGQPQRTHWVNVTDPPALDWWVMAYPHGPLAQQTWTLDVLVEGEGSSEGLAVDGGPGAPLCEDEPAEAASRLSDVTR